MAQRSRGITGTLVAGAVLGVWLCVRMIFESGKEIPWIVGGVISLILLAVCVWGMWGMKRWALALSFVLAAGALVLGGWAVHFAWTFWIFQEPTLGDKIKAVLHPQVSLLILAPLVWLAYFLRRPVRAQFPKGRS